MPYAIHSHGACVLRAGRVAVSSLAVLLVLAASARAATPATRGELTWQSGTVRTSPQDASTLTAALAARGPGIGGHAVVQFERPLAPVERAALEGHGLRLLSYVGDNAYFAGFDAARSDPAAIMAVAPLRCVLAPERNWKLHRNFAEAKAPAWAVLADGQPKDATVAPAGPLVAPAANVKVAAYLLLHADVPLSDGVRLCRAGGVSVRSELPSINGLVVEGPFGVLLQLADDDRVRWLEPPLPKFSELNNSNRARVGADIVAAPPYGLTGSGVKVLVYDGGYALQSHGDFQGRLTVRDSSGLSDHATHVSGTVGGAGVGNPLYRGMAPGVTIESYGFEQEGGLQQGFLYTDPGDIEVDYSQAINFYGADISNNSIGTNTAPNGYPCEWEGNYGATDVLIDTIVRGDGGNPLFDAPFRIVWANGNERQVSRCLGIEGYPSPYHSTAPPACGKNHITVGAMNSNDDSVTTFTSFGPSDDGRLKPDISGPGCQSDDDGGVTSCSSSGGYTDKCGTSMSSPTVCGISALLLQDYRLQYPELPDFRNSTLKVLLAHTAVDIVRPGPDYESGYGSVRIQPAVDLMRSGNFLENTIDQGDTYSVIVIVAPGDPQLRVTLAWDDVPGNPAITNQLVNDLDLRVFNSADQQFYPWTLAPMNPTANAVRTQPDHNNNIEQVVIDSPPPGAYRVEIFGYNVPQGPQPFSLTATPYLVNCSSQGTATLDRPKYPCTAGATLRVIDCDLNTSDTVVDTVAVNLASTSEPAGETVTLTETAPESAAFLGSIPLNQTGGAGVLTIAPGDTVTLTYNDADDGSGSPAVVTDTALVDCTAPAVSGVYVDPLNPRDATIHFTTDEPAQVVVRYGVACSFLNDLKSAIGFRTNHALTLTGLTDDTTYYYAIDAVDEAGNPATADNGGSCYSFTTPEVPDFFTELFTAGNDLDNLSVSFIPNGSNDFYLACVEPITALPTDPTGGTVIDFAGDIDDGYVSANLTGGAQVSLYGVSYGSLYIGTNGYVTFGSGDDDYSESLALHFGLPRVAALFDDLKIEGAGSVRKQQLADRFVVTWLNVPEYNQSNSNTFQIELYFSGQITISYLAIAAGDGLAGLSNGGGVDPEFFMSDLSALGPCQQFPPTASDQNFIAGTAQMIEVNLAAQDDGLPSPPGHMEYTVLALPPHGTLSVPGGGPITSAPYTLPSGGRRLQYASADPFVGEDAFTWLASDGGIAPDGGDSNIATVTVNVYAVPRPKYVVPLDANPGWGLEGAWAFGPPQGLGTHDRDPTVAHSGASVYGYNLAGDYANNLSGPRYLTTTPFDCSALTAVQLRFWRWLGVERFDHASVEASGDGVNWTVLWENPAAANVSDTGWSQMSFDLSALADGQSAVRIRWSIGPTDNTISFPGWNVDDVEIWGIVPYIPPICRGDTNCDGSVGFADIDTFVAAIPNNEAAWRAMFLPDVPACTFAVCDVNDDGNVGFDDIDPFVARIPSACP